MKKREKVDDRSLRYSRSWRVLSRKEEIKLIPRDARQRARGERGSQRAKEWAAIETKLFAGAWKKSHEVGR